MHVGGCDLEEHPGSTVWPCVDEEDRRYPWMTAVVFSSLLLLPVHVCAVLQLLVTAKQAGGGLLWSCSSAEAAGVLPSSTCTAVSPVSSWQGTRVPSGLVPTQSTALKAASSWPARCVGWRAQPRGDVLRPPVPPGAPGGGRGALSFRLVTLLLTALP